MSIRNLIATAAGLGTLAVFDALMAPMAPQDTAGNVPAPIVDAPKPARAATVIGNLTITADVVQGKDDKAPRLMLHAENKGDAGAKVPVRVMLYEREDNMMSRMPSFPRPVFSKDITLDVPAGKSVDLPVDTGDVPLAGFLPGAEKAKDGEAMLSEIRRSIVVAPATGDLATAVYTLSDLVERQP